MRIVLVRHADAVSEGPGLPDEHRYLSAAGRQQSRELGALLAEANIVVGAAICSPLVRAVQTAELVLASIGWGGPLEASARIAPGGSTRQTAAYLTERAEKIHKALVVVGHEPSISALAELLGSGERVSAFHKAEAALVEDGVLQWRLGAP